MSRLALPLSFALAFALGSSVLVACAKKEERSLPGDSVGVDGSVTLSPARMSTAPRETAPAREAREPLGAIESRVFAPELVMDHQSELSIDASQKEAIIHEVEQSQAEMVRLQWELQGEKEKLAHVLDADHVDEAKSREAAARLMERENKVKAGNLAMLVRVKNLLTPAQQKKLRELRDGASTPPASSITDAGKDASSPR
jgi:Spy/CpxP family protein refolding chaperone